VSEVLGTIVLLAGTIVIIATVGVMIASANEETIPPRLDVTARAEPGDDSIRILHAGGDSFDLGNVDAHIAVDHETWYRGGAGSNGDTWAIGEILEFDSLPDTLVKGAAVDVTLFTPGETLAMVSFRVGGAGSGLGGGDPGEAFNVKLFFNSTNGSEPTSIDVTPPADILVFARVEHPLGRTAVSSVELDASQLGGSTVATMFDDGTNGDATPGDGVYSRTVHVPSSLRPLGTKTIMATATDSDGFTRSANGTVHLADTGSGPKLVFDPSLISDAAIRVSKHAGAPGDAVLPHVKLRLVADTVTRDGITYSLSGGWFTYLPVYPGQAHDPIQLDVIRSGAACDPRIVVLSTRGEAPAVITGYDRYEEPVYYFIDLEWEQVGPGKATFRSPVDSSREDQYIVFRRDEEVQVMKNGDWPASFDDCKDE
jgi:FlaG/FlaF family flagellin (archaellin)